MLQIGISFCISVSELWIKTTLNFHKDNNNTCEGDENSQTFELFIGDAHEHLLLKKSVRKKILVSR